VIRRFMGPVRMLWRRPLPAGG